MHPQSTQYAGLQTAARYRALRRLLRRSAIGLGIFGLIGLAVGFISLQFDFINIILVVLGALLLLQAVLNIVMPHPLLLLSEGSMLILLGMWNIAVTVLNTANGGRVGGFTFIAIFQVIWGIITIKSFSDYRNLPKTPPPPDMQSWLDQTAAGLRKLRPADDPGVIEFFTVQIGQNIAWKGRLAADSLTLVDTAGARIEILGRHEIGITPGKPIRLQKQMFSARINLRNKQYQGRISETSLQRFQAWQQHTPNAPEQLWVPRV